MRPHAPSLDWGPALVDLRTAAHVSTAMRQGGPWPQAAEADCGASCAAS